MRPGSLALTIGSALVAIGGLYLFIELNGASPTPAVATAQPQPGKAAGSMIVETSAPPPNERPATKPRPASPKPTGPALTPPQFGKQFDPEMAAKLGPDQPPVPVDTAEYLLEANKLYDRGDYDGARSLAIKLLGEAPGNVRLLRVVVSSSCIMGDADVANQYAGQLPKVDHDQMIDRCAKFQIALK